MAKNKTLLVLEVGSAKVAEIFEEVVGREPTDSELESAIDAMGDLYKALRFEYVVADIEDYITNVISERFN